MQSYSKSLPRAFARGFAISTAIAVVIATSSCSKPISQNRYDGAMELAKSYSIQATPKDFLSALGPAVSKEGYGFADLALSHSFSGKFETAAEELDKREYLQPDNRSLLEGIIADSKLPCDYNSTSPTADVDCGIENGALPYKSGDIRLLHTDAGDFVFSSADMFRGNGNESNANKSAVVIVVDPTDGGLGIILEDRIATVGGRHDVIAAALTLASAIVRLEDSDNQTKLSPNNLKFDLQAAKSKTLYKNPTYMSNDAAVHRLTLAHAQRGFDEVDRRLAGQTRLLAPTDQPPASETSGPFTKDQFKNLVIGKTMAQIRSAIGEPSNVDSHADGVLWFYWSNRLPVRDPDSGITYTSSSILFDPASKVAIKVGF